ncbi:MAG: ATP--guanido phosphotransferase, partial [Bacillota bacterium]
WALACQVDDVIEAGLDYAYSPEIGYLTAFPTNAGTGLRASVMMHLPALVMTEKINKILSAIGQVGLVARGIYGEGTQAQGSIFQISNQITLGQSEPEIIDNISGVTKQIIEQERAARRALQNAAAIDLHDRVARACGVLSNARKMSSQEAMQLLSDLRLGLSLQLVSGLDHAAVDEMLVITHPAWLTHEAGRDLDPNERDTRRAGAIRERMAGVKC